MENKQTAVDLMYWRAINVLPLGAIDAEIRLEEMYLQAKQMEKEQIVNAYNESFILRDKPYSTAVKYYNETYGGNNEN
jgi:hypothetical protein